MRLRRRRLVRNQVVGQVGVCRHDDVAKVTRLVFSLNIRNVPHHNIHECILNQTQKYENRAATHKNVDGLQ